MGWSYENSVMLIEEQQLENRVHSIAVHMFGMRALHEIIFPRLRESEIHSLQRVDLDSLGEVRAISGSPRRRTR